MRDPLYDMIARPEIRERLVKQVAKHKKLGRKHAEVSILETDPPWDAKWREKNLKRLIKANVETPPVKALPEEYSHVLKVALISGFDERLIELSGKNLKAGRA
jgi:hypothetical protein